METGTIHHLQGGDAPQSSYGLDTYKKGRLLLKVVLLECQNRNGTVAVLQFSYRLLSLARSALARFITVQFGNFTFCLPGYPHNSSQRNSRTKWGRQEEICATNRRRFCSCFYAPYGSISSCGCDLKFIQSLWNWSLSIFPGPNCSGSCDDQGVTWSDRSCSFIFT